MSDLITRPDTPWQGFWQGFGGAALAVGVPLTVICLFQFSSSGLFRVLGFCVAFTAAVSLVAGLGLALWRAVQGWAYARFKEGP